MWSRSILLDKISVVYPGADPGDSRSWIADVSGEYVKLYYIKVSGIRSGNKLVTRRFRKRNWVAL